jgi:hypothetical protein
MPLRDRPRRYTANRATRPYDCGEKNSATPGLERDHWGLEELIASTAIPGPNAISHSGAAARRFTRSRNTNSTDGDDMLPKSRRMRREIGQGVGCDAEPLLDRVENGAPAKIERPQRDILALRSGKQVARAIRKAPWRIEVGVSE